MFTPDPEQSYVMPAHFGGRYQGTKTSGWYRDVTSIIVSYVTDRERLAAYIPEPFELTETPIISVVYACNKQVDWLAGRGYNLVAVNASVIFNGEQDVLTGTYCLVMWENLTDPILSGRELQGIPKIYADIEDYVVDAGGWRCSASHYGNTIVELIASELVTPSAEDIALFQSEQAGKDHPMAWRYLPGVGGRGSALNEFTLFPSENHIDEVQVGEGELVWHPQTWEQNPTQFHIVNALADLPVLEYLPAIVTRGSCNLVLAGQPTRVLK